MTLTQLKFFIYTLKWTFISTALYSFPVFTSSFISGFTVSYLSNELCMYLGLLDISSPSTSHEVVEMIKDLINTFEVAKGNIPSEDEKRVVKEIGKIITEFNDVEIGVVITLSIIAVCFYLTLVDIALDQF